MVNCKNQAHPSHDHLPLPRWQGQYRCVLFIAQPMQYAVRIMNRASSDEDLMLRYRDGEASAFETLYERYRGPLFRYLFRQCGNEAVAEELFQDIWIKLIQARERYQVQAKFKTYLYHIAHNRLIDHYRRSTYGVPASFAGDDPPDMDDFPGSEVDRPDHVVDQQQQFDRLLELAEQLPEAQREAFLLRQQANMSLDEIATATGVDRETAKSRVRYAVAKLRKGMGMTT